MRSRVQNILKGMYAAYPLRRHGMANNGALWVASGLPLILGSEEISSIHVFDTRTLDFRDLHSIFKPPEKSILYYVFRIIPSNIDFA